MPSEDHPLPKQRLDLPNVGSLIGFWGFLIVIMVYWVPKPYSKYEGPTLNPKAPEPYNQDRGVITKWSKR